MNTYIKKCWKFFDRGRLKKVYIIERDDRTIHIRVVTLDKDSLAISILQSHWTKATFEIVASCLIHNGLIFDKRSLFTIDVADNNETD